MTFVDTNYFIRFLLNDITDQYTIAYNLFELGAKGKKKLFTSVLVFFEIYWLFTSFYEKDKAEVCEILAKILSMNFVYIDDRNLLVNSLDLYKHTVLDLEDSYNCVLAKSKKADSFATFDNKLLRAFSK